MLVANTISLGGLECFQKRIHPIDKRIQKPGASAHADCSTGRGWGDVMRGWGVTPGKTTLCVKPWVRSLISPHPEKKGLQRAPTAWILHLSRTVPPRSVEQFTVPTLPVDFRQALSKTAVSVDRYGLASQNCLPLWENAASGYWHYLSTVFTHLQHKKNIQMT